MSVFDELEARAPEWGNLYRDLHEHPELAFQEVRTAGIVAERLERCGWKVTTGVGRTGVVGVLSSGDGPIVMLRADMDALPVKERTNLPFASTAVATDGNGETVPVMHACGHDMHVAALVGACELLAAAPDAWQGTVIAIFQPGEESGFGARSMIDDGLFTRFPKPDVILGQHVGPGPAGLIATCSGTVMGATDSITVRLIGRGGHGSKPEATIDPVVMAASLVLRLQTIASRLVSAQEAVVVTVGRLHAGTTAAVIPAEAELGINVRTPSPRVRERVLADLERLVKAEAVAAGAPPPEITSVYALPVTVNDGPSTERVAAAHRAHFDLVVELGTQTASEDFGLLGASAMVPSVFWFIGGVDAERFGAAFAAGRVNEDIPANHSDNFEIVVQPTLNTGVKALLTAALAWLEPQ